MEAARGRSEDFGLRNADFGLTESKRCAGLSGKRVNRQIKILPAPLQKEKFSNAKKFALRLYEIIYKKGMM
jgi:hypothetical protein